MDPAPVGFGYFTIKNLIDPGSDDIQNEINELDCPFANSVNQQRYGNPEKYDIYKNEKLTDLVDKVKDKIAIEFSLSDA